MKLNSAVKFEFQKLLKHFKSCNSNILNSHISPSNASTNNSSPSNSNNHLEQIIKILERMLDENQTEVSFKEDLAFLQSLIDTKASNFIEAALVLGYWYKVGIELNDICAEIAAKHAFELFQIAANGGNAIGQYNVGFFYMDGLGITKDEKRGNEFFQLAVDQGNSDALNDLGYSYQYGRGMAKDEKRAIELYQLAVHQGHILAINNLAFCYEHGQGVPKNEQDAASYYSLSAALGSDDGQNSLGCYFQDGIGVPKDEKRAFELFQQAASQGNVHAYNNLAFCYNEGRGVIKDKQLAFQHYQYAASRGNEVAQKNLARCYLVGDGVTADTKLAVETFHYLENQGIRSLDELAICYKDGLGVRKNRERLILLTQACILHNIGKSDLHSSLLYHIHNNEKVGYYPDLDNAVAYYKTFAYEHNDTSALSTIAFCYQMGLGTDRNLEFAIQLYLEALQKDEDCYWDLYICYVSRADTEDARKAILDFYKNVLEPQAEKHPAAASLLGYLFERGSLRIVGVERNLFTALRYYKKSQPPWFSAEDTSRQDYVSKKIRYYTPLLNNIKTACQNSLPEILSSDGISSIIAEYAFEHGANKCSI